MKLKFFRSQFFFNDEYSPAFILNESHHESKEISRFKCFQKKFPTQAFDIIDFRIFEKNEGSTWCSAKNNRFFCTCKHFGHFFDYYEYDDQFLYIF